MVSWVLIAVVVLFPLIQVPLVIYLARYTRLREGETPGRPEVRDYWTGTEGGTGAGETGPSGTEASDSGHQRTETPPDTVTCPACGAENARAYRFCGTCASTLGATAD